MSHVHLVKAPAPEIDLLSSPAATAYFDVRECKAYYDSLKRVEPQRRFHADLIDVCTSFLDVTSDEAQQAVVDKLISRHRIIVGEVDVENLTRDVKQRHPRGCELLELQFPLTLDELKSSYRASVLKHHPDRGGQHADMVSINEAYTELHCLILKEQFADESDDENDGGVEAANCVDFRNDIGKLLLYIHLDDWALDRAFQYLQLISSDEWARTPYTERRLRRAELAGVAVGLAKRLSLTPNRSEAERCLQWAIHVAHAVHEYDQTFESLVNDAEQAIAGTKKPRVVLNHLRQATNALRLGVIDQTQFQKAIDKIAKTSGDKRSEEEGGSFAFHKYVNETGLLKSLPSDRTAIVKRSILSLVPEPEYFETRLSELSEDQQAEYAAAFGDAPVFVLAKKYFFVRMQSLLETAILHDDGPTFGELERDEVLGISRTV